MKISQRKRLISIAAFCCIIFLFFGCSKKHDDDTPAEIPLIQAPDAPTKLAAVFGLDWKVKLTWSDYETIADGYIIEEKRGQNSSWIEIGKTTNYIFQYYQVEQEIAPLEEVCYRIAGYNKDGISPYSNEVCVKIASNIEIVGEITTRVAKIVKLDGSINNAYCVYGRIKNTGTAPAQDILLNFNFFDKQGVQLDSRSSPARIFGDLKKNYYGGIDQNYLLPDHEGAFMLIISNYNLDIVSAAHELKWFDGEIYQPQGKINLLPDTIKLTQQGSNIELAATFKNTGENCVHSIQTAIVAKDSKNNIVHIFVNNIELPKNNYCYFSGKITKCLQPGDEFNLISSYKEDGFPADSIVSYEPFISFNTADNMPAVTGQVEFVVRSQTNSLQSGDGYCSTFSRLAGNDRIDFFSGCGFSFTFRGFNIAVIDSSNGTLKDFKTFDTWYEREANDRLAAYLPTISAGDIVLISIADEGTYYLSQESRDAIASALGSKMIYDIEFNDGFALAVVKGKNSTLVEGWSDYSSSGFKAAEVRLFINLPAN